PALPAARATPAIRPNPRFLSDARSAMSLRWSLSSWSTFSSIRSRIVSIRVSRSPWVMANVLDVDAHRALRRPHARRSGVAERHQAGGGASNAELLRVSFVERPTGSDERCDRSARLALKPESGIPADPSHRGKVAT